MSTTRSFLTRFAPFLGATLAFALLVGGTQLYASWTAAPASPPNNNVDAPLNVGSDPQVKSGPLTTMGSLYTHGNLDMRDPANNNPAGIIMENEWPHIHFWETDNTAKYTIAANGNQLQLLYDRDNDGNWDWPAPAIFHTHAADPTQDYAHFKGYVRADSFQDANNAGYYVDPTWWTQLNGLAVAGDSVVPYPDDFDDIASKQYVDDMMGGSNNYWIQAFRWDPVGTGGGYQHVYFNGFWGNSNMTHPSPSSQHFYFYAPVAGAYQVNVSTANHRGCDSNDDVGVSIWYNNLTPGGTGQLIHQGSRANIGGGTYDVGVNATALLSLPAGGYVWVNVAEECETVDRVFFSMHKI